MLRLLISVMLLVPWLPQEVQADPPTKPADVLPYLEQAYKNGDIEAYSNLLSSDFKFTLEDMDASWDKAMDVRGTSKLFEATRAELTFTGDLSVKPGPDAGTWAIEDVTGHLQVTQKKDGKVFRVENTFTFIIRDEDGNMRIAEWRQKPSK